MRRNYPFNAKVIKDQAIKNNDYCDIKLDPIDYCFSLGVGLTSKCNLRCPFCYYREDSVSKIEHTELELSKFTNLLENLPKLNKIVFSLEGEGLCYKNFKDALRIATQHCRSLEITTNGLLLTDDIISLFKEVHLAKCILSIDAADESNYKIYRKGGNFTKFCSNAKQLTNSIGQDKVMFYSVVNNKNLDSLSKLPILAKEVGILEIGLGQIRENSNSKINGLSRASQKELIEFLTNICVLADSLNITIVIEEHFASPDMMLTIKRMDLPIIIISNKDKSMFCTMPWFFTSIMSKGELFACCGDIEPQKINEYSFDGIFNHELLRHLRWLIKTGNIPEVCLQCHNIH